jgi:carboxypeptidase Q
MRHFLLIVLFPSLFCAQNTQKIINDSSFIRKVYDEALLRGKAYEDLRELCKNVGHRLTGSAEAAMAVKWSEEKMISYGFDKVYLQAIKVPHWERGNAESGWYTDSDGVLHKLHILALGGSISTHGLLNAPLIEFKTFESLKKAKRKDIEGKIVFINQEMDATQIQTFKAYGGCYPIRGEGAIESSKLGAVGVIIRSLGIPEDDFPHTGSMKYDSTVAKIPAAAISTHDAEMLSKAINKGKVKLYMELDCRLFPDTDSYNVIAEMKGKKSNEIITFGGHLDSWDTGEGAHDDGAGVIHCLEALRILKTLKYEPLHTLRVVFFMNEENGNMGGKTYASWSKNNGEIQYAALESDRGGFAPRGFGVDGSPEQISHLKSFESLFNTYDLNQWEKGGGGVDIGPLKDYFPSIPLYGFIPDSQRYFDFHHSPNDVFENVNKRELELGAAAISSFIYLIDKHPRD